MRPHRLDIRPASAGDLDRVAVVWRESAGRMDGAPVPLPSECDLRARIDRELECGWELHVADYDGSIVGMLAIKRANAMLDQLFVAQAMQRSGVGTALLQVAKREMPTGFTLRMAANNDRARRFYERSGMILRKQGLHPRTGEPVHYLG